MKKLLPILLLNCLSVATAWAQMTEQQVKEQLKASGVNLSPDELKKATQVANSSANQSAPAIKVQSTEVAKADIKQDIQQKVAEQVASGATAKEALVAATDAAAADKNDKPAAIFGQHIFRKKEITFFNKVVGDVQPTDSYIVGTGDEIAVNIWGHAEFSGTAAINGEGFARYSNPSIPRLYVRGLTWGRTKDKVISQFRQAFNLGNNTQIDVRLNYSRIISVNIVGEAVNPNTYAISALNTATNALVAADGVSDRGSVRSIKVSSVGKPDRILDLYQFLLNPLSSQEFFLENNDYIYVPSLGNDKIVSLEGSVVRPYRYELLPTENLSDLLRWSGGLQPNAYKGTIQIKRFENDEIRLIDINFNDLENRKGDFTLKNGDRVIVHAIDEEYYTNFAEIVGSVKLPGRYQIEKGKTRIADFLTKAALRDDANTQLVYLSRLQTDLSYLYYRIDVDALRKNPDSPDNMLMEYRDIMYVYSKANFHTDYSINISGAVRKPGDIILNENTTLKDVLFQAGGLKLEADNGRVEVSRVDLSRGNESRIIITSIQLKDTTFSMDDPALVMKMQPFDQVFVRSNPDFALPRNIGIGGEVRYPGAYTLIRSREKLLDLIKRSGGFTESADLRGITLVRKEEGVGFLVVDLEKAFADPESTHNYILEAGDEIRVPRLKHYVTIQGAVDYPRIEDLKRISMAYEKGRNLYYYVEEYTGGLSRENKGSYRNVLVAYPNGRVRKTKMILGVIPWQPKIEAGCLITIRTKPGTRAPKATPDTPGGAAAGAAPEVAQTSKVDWETLASKLVAQAVSVLTLVVLLSNIK